MKAPSPANLWHYTCSHGRHGLDDGGWVKPAVLLDPERGQQLPWPTAYAWFTDLATPVADVLGLTNHLIKCDRTQHRYRVTDVRQVVWWPLVARNLRHLRNDLEGAPGARPCHWWVATSPVPVVYDPMEGGL